MKQLSLRGNLLETRALPAGTIAASVAGGILTLVGDDDNNAVQLNQAGGSITVVGLSGTTITGGPTFAGVTGLTARLGDGNDSLQIDNTVPFTLTGAANVDLGDGNNTLGLATGGLLELGALTVDTGDGHDWLTVMGSVGSKITGNVRLDLGVGYNSQEPPYLDTQATFVNTEILGAGGLKYNALDGDDKLTLQGVKIARALNVKGGEGSVLVTANDSQIGSVLVNSNGPSYPLSTNAAGFFATTTTINGSVTVTSKDGVQVVYDGVNSGSLTTTAGSASDTTIALQGTSTITGNLLATGGRISVLPANGSSITVTQRVTVLADGYASLNMYGGQLTTPTMLLNGRAGADIYLTDDDSFASTAQVNVANTLTLRGSYVQYIQQSGEINAGALSLFGGTATRGWLGSSYSNDLPLTKLNVVGATLMQGRTLEFTQYESLATFGNGLTMQGGELTTFLAQPWQMPGDPLWPDYPPYGNGATTTVNGKPFLLSGRNVTYSQYEGIANYPAGLTIKAQDEALLETYPKDYGTNPDSTDNYGLGAKLTAGQLLMTGAAVDYYQAAGEATFTRGVKLDAKGSASFDTEAEFLPNALGAKVNVPNGHVEILGGGDASYSQSDGEANISGNLNVKGKYGGSVGTSWYDAVVGAKLTVGGSINLDGGTGQTGFEDAGEALTVTGDVNVKGGGLSRSYFSSNGGSTVGGNISITGATGYPDYVTTETNLTVGGNLTINLGSGANDIYLGVEDATQIAGRLNVTTGNGSDRVALANVTVAGPTTILTGAGTDRLHLLKGATFNGTLNADLGSGADTFAAGQAFLDGFGNEVVPIGTVTINAATTVKLGANNDVMYLGLTGDPDGKVLFGATGTLTVDGGANLNLFDNEAGQFDPLKLTLVGVFVDPTP